MTKGQEDRRIGFALVLLILAFGFYGQCAPAQASEGQIIPPCTNGEIRVSAETGVTIQCVDGEWDAIITVTESQKRVSDTSLVTAMISAFLGMAFGIAAGRRSR